MLTAVPHPIRDFATLTFSNLARPPHLSPRGGGGDASAPYPRSGRTHNAHMHKTYPCVTLPARQPAHAPQTRLPPHPRGEGWGGGRRPKQHLAPSIAQPPRRSRLTAQRFIPPTCIFPKKPDSPLPLVGSNGVGQGPRTTARHRYRDLLFARTVTPGRARSAPTGRVRQFDKPLSQKCNGGETHLQTQIPV